jgi:sugar phosphate isomerase/epimerase
MMSGQPDIRIGTLLRPSDSKPGDYIRQILPHGFESFSMWYWRVLGDANLPRLADEIRQALGDSGAVISSVSIYGNPLETTATDLEALRGWQELIDHAHLFGTNIVAGFTGRLRGRSIDDSLPRFKAIFEPLAKRAADQGVRLAFENCAMGGNWKSGDWNIAHNPAAWEKMFDVLPMDNIGLQWEPCNQMTQLIEPLPQLRSKWAKKIFHVHGKCATIKWDIIREYGIDGPVQFAYHRTPGFGDLDWTRIISDLRLAGFKGSIDIEGLHDPIYRGALEMTGQVYGLNYLKRCRGGEFVPNPT